MEKAFEHSALPDQPDPELINALTFELRNKFYEIKENNEVKIYNDHLWCIESLFFWTVDS